MIAKEFIAECADIVELYISRNIKKVGVDQVTAYAAYRWGFSPASAPIPQIGAVTAMGYINEQTIENMEQEVTELVTEYGEGFVTDIFCNMLGLVPGNPHLKRTGSFDGSDKGEAEGSPGIFYHLENLESKIAQGIREEVMENASSDAIAFFDEKLGVGLNYDPERLIDASKLSSKMWGKLRAYSVGASSAASVMGESPYGNAQEEWHKKLGHIPEEDIDADKQRIFDWGHMTETYMRSIVISKHPEFADCKVIVEPMIFSSQAFPFLTANLDAILEWPDGHYSILEFKAPTPHAKHYYSDGNIPEYYEIQMQQQMMLLNIDEAFLVALFDRDTFTVSRCVRSLDTQMQIAQSIEMFWGYCEAKIEPPLNGPSEVIIKNISSYRKYNNTGKNVELDPQLWGDVLAQASKNRQEKEKNAELIKVLDKEYGELMAPLFDAVGYGGCGICEDPTNHVTYGVYCKEGRQTVTLKKATQNKLKSQDPALYAAIEPYLSRSVSKPSLVLKNELLT